MKTAVHPRSELPSPKSINEPGEIEIPDEPSDLEELDPPWTDDDDARWEPFIPDEDERDPLPEPGDFWIDSDVAVRNAA